MKALSVRQPWAYSIAHEFKTIEWRSWLTDYRGPLLICSAVKPDFDLTRDFSVFEREQCFPLGVGVCLVDLADCRVFTHGDLEPAMMEQLPRPVGYAWVLKNPQPLNERIPIKGRQRLFEVAADPSMF